MLVGLAMVLLLVCAGIYALAPHPPATPKQVANWAELDAYLTALTGSGSPPGLSVVIVRDGHVTYSRSFGMADGPRHVEATPETVYHWWSMTKIPTAMAILQLREQGTLQLSDAVATYLPWFEVEYPSSTRPTITIRDLLQHTSGLADTMPAMIGWVHYDDEGRNQTAVAKTHLPALAKLKFEPGQRSTYSNLNYMLLGAVVEAASGDTYESYVTRQILQPLGMSSTAFVYAPRMIEHASAGTLPIVHYYTPLLPYFLDASALIRQRQGKLFWLNKVYIDATPSTGLIGSAPDVARFMLAYLGGGVLDGRRILQPESIRLMTETAPIDGRGLAWVIGAHNGARFLEHWGGGPGFATFMRLYPDRNLGIAVLANGTDLDRSGLADLLATMELSRRSGDHHSS
ncbi:MAG: serine hydrolase domain-containing protein [Vicinamibacterales bacterium]